MQLSGIFQRPLITQITLDYTDLSGDKLIYVI